MNELFEASLRFPTVIFTIGLGVALVYWLFVLLGALDIDVFGGDAAAGASKGGVEALKGIKGISGGGETDGVADGGHDGGFWDFIGVAHVPITISFSVIVLLGWVLSVLGMHHGPSLLGGDLGGWLAPLLLLAVLVVAVLVGGRLLKPLGPVFHVQSGKSNQDYVGHFCTITTGHVDDGFGQATLEDGGTVLVIPVRCDKPGLGRGHKALIIDFDRAREAYLVEPTTDLMARTGEE